MTDVIALAQELIRTPSPVYDGDETQVAGLVADAMQTLGLPAPQTLALKSDRPNLVSTIDFGPGGSHLILCGHLDTKPVGGAQWTVDPFGADIDGDRLYGLGSADMKAAIAAILVAVAGVADEGAQGAGKVTLLLCADEEDGATYGAQFLAKEAALSADAMVIGEPGGLHHDFDGLHLVSRGLGRFMLTAQGTQGHSSLKDIFDRPNAGVDLARAVALMADLAEPRLPANVDSLRDWNATVNPAMTYVGGIGYGVLPEQMSARVEVRTLPGMTDAELLEDLREATVGARGSISVDLDTEAAHWTPATSVAKHSRIAKSAARALDRVRGEVPPASVFPGTTDTSWFAPTGIPSLPALGPGLISRAHAADEWVSVAAVRESVDIYAALVEDFCAGSETQS